MDRPVFSSDGRVVANIDGDLLYKNVDSRRHKLMRPPAWAFDVAVITTAEQAEVNRIEVFATDTGRRYRVGMDKFLEKAIQLDRGHNKQLALPMRYWSTGEGQQGELRLDSATNVQAPITVNLREDNC